MLICYDEILTFKPSRKELITIIGRQRLCDAFGIKGVHGRRSSLTPSCDTFAHLPISKKNNGWQVET